MPNIYNMLTIVGHRFGHQSGIDVSSERISTTFRHAIALRIHLVFSEIGKTASIDNYYQEQLFFPKQVV